MSAKVNGRFWLLPSLILRGIRRFYADTKIIFAPGKCLSHKYQPVLVLHITMKIKSRHNVQKKWLQNNAKWWRTISLIGKCSTTDVLQKRIPTKLSLSCSDLAILLYLFVSIRSAKVQWRISIIIRSVHISFVMQQHQLKWKRTSISCFRAGGLGGVANGLLAAANGWRPTAISSAWEMIAKRISKC